MCSYGRRAGLSAGEVTAMLKSRPVRTAVWVLMLTAAGVAAGTVEVDRTAGVPFQVRPVTHAEIQAKTLR